VTDRPGPSRAAALVAFAVIALSLGMTSVAAPTAGSAPKPTPRASTLGPGTPAPTPAPVASAATPAPTGLASAPPGGPSVAPATPVPSGVLVRFSGQILDLRDGFVFFTTGDGFRLDPGVRYTDFLTGGPTKLVPKTGGYASAGFNPVTGEVVVLALSRKPLAVQASYEDIQRFAVVASTPQPNPELVAKEGITGRPVIVTFTALVPITTQLGDIVYMQTDQSNWNPQAIRLDRIDALHYRVTLRLDSGTAFLYRYTRGSSQSVEVGRNGLQISPRNFFVKNLEVKNQDDTVYNWADQNPAGNAPPGPDSIPTPYNPQPFPAPFPARPTVPPRH
jgi:hypothetical protein